MTAENLGEPDFSLPKISPSPQITLDLHGFSVLEARDSLENFLYSCRNDGLFHLRIITGKGTGALFSEVFRLLDRKKAHREIRKITRGEGFFLVILE